MIVEGLNPVVKKKLKNNFLAKIFKAKLDKLIEEEKTGIEKARKPNVEKIIEILRELKNNSNLSGYEKKINWAIDRLQYGKFYNCENETDDNNKGDFFQSLAKAYVDYTEQNINSIKSDIIFHLHKKDNQKKSLQKIDEEEIKQDKKPISFFNINIKSPSSQSKSKININSLYNSPISHVQKNISSRTKTPIKLNKRKKILSSTSENHNTLNTKNIYNDFGLFTLNEIRIEKIPILENKIQDFFIGNLHEEILPLITNVSDINLNLFDFINIIGRKNYLTFIYYSSIYTILPDYFKEIDKVKMSNFMKEIYQGYKREVAYHNDLHGSDLCQVINVWMTKTNMIESLKFKDIDIFSLFTAAVVHDFKHPGTNNGFQINMMTDIALTFNDVSVLESYHISEANKVLKKYENNFIGETFTLDECKYIRKRMIDCVLATDMSAHSKVISNIKSKMDVNNIIKGENIEKLIDANNLKKLYEDHQDILSLIIHLADLAHNSKSSEISFKWSIMLYDEFFTQGDIEKSLNKSISFLCDRETTNIAKSQIGFIKFFITPSFEILYNMFPDTEYFYKNTIENTKFWEKKVLEEEEIQNKNFI